MPDRHVPQRDVEVDDVVVCSGLTNTLSHGNKQKVHLVQAFMHAPDLLILDEPTLGLDPLIQREFRALRHEAVAAGATVLLSSPVLAEVELICDRIGLTRKGRLLRVGSHRPSRADVRPPPTTQTRAEPGDRARSSPRADLRSRGRSTAGPEALVGMSSAVDGASDRGQSED